MRLPSPVSAETVIISGNSELASVPRVSQAKYYCIFKSLYQILFTGTATTLVMGHEPVLYETLKFCGSFLQIYYVKVRGPK